MPSWKRRTGDRREIPVYLVNDAGLTPQARLAELAGLGRAIDNFVAEMDHVQPLPPELENLKDSQFLWPGLEPGRKFRLAFTLYVIMAKSISVKRKKAGRPATGTEPLYGVRMSDDLIGRIQKWGRENSATRSEAIRRLIELGLKKEK